MLAFGTHTHTHTYKHIHTYMFVYMHIEKVPECCHFSCVRLLATLWTVAHQPPLSMEFSRQEYLVALPSFRGSS